MSRNGSLRSAFTLVELLVVIGIIAILIGVLLPVMGRVQSKGRDIKCQANIRQLVVALRGYAEENRGVFPYGMHWTRTNKPIPNAQSLADTDQPGSNQDNFTCWASQITKYMRRGKVRSGFENDDTNFSEILQCPEAVQSRPHIISYVMNMVVGVEPYAEFQTGARRPNAQVRPPSVTNLLKDTVLVWDTACFDGGERNVGALVGADIDGQRMWDGANNPWYRYYSLADPFADPALLAGKYGQNQPVQMEPFGFSPKFKNVDPPGASNQIPYQGNLRFRHQGGTACNAGFVDGHVEPFLATVNGDKTIKTHTALRRYFMIKPPTGVSFPDLGQ